MVSQGNAKLRVITNFPFPHVDNALLVLESFLESLVVASLACDQLNVFRPL